MKKSQLSAAIKLAKVIDTLYDIYDAGGYDIYDIHEIYAESNHKDKLERVIQQTYSAIKSIVLVPHWVIKGHKETQFYVSEHDVDDFFETEPNSAKTIAFLKKLYENQHVREYYENGEYKDLR